MGVFSFLFFFFFFFLFIILNHINLFFSFADLRVIGRFCLFPETVVFFFFLFFFLMNSIYSNKIIFCRLQTVVVIRLFSFHKNLREIR